MKTKELLIQEIESKLTDKITDYLIGYRGYPQSLILLQKHKINILFGENCLSENDAKFIVDYFIAKGMKLENRYSLNISKGIYVFNNK
jgi:hypothetical protein